MQTSQKWVGLIVLGLVVGTGVGIWSLRLVPLRSHLASGIDVSQERPSLATVAHPLTADFGGSVQFVSPATDIAPSVSGDFDVSQLKNVADMERTYGFTFSSEEKKRLAKDKFVMKRLLDTSLRPYGGRDVAKEFEQLYELTKGPNEPRDRTQANAQYYSSDVFFDAYNNLFVELLKELENRHFYPNMLALTKSFYEGASAHLSRSVSDADKNTWTKVRNYFAVPYALFSTAAEPLSNASYNDTSGNMRDPATVMAEFKDVDGKIDTFENASAFVKKLGLDADSESLVLADLQQAYEAKGRVVPAIFKPEYDAYAKQTDIGFQVDFTQFTPRGTYTSSSLRREYFRGMKWYIMLPFFVKSADLTTYAFAVTQLMAEDAKSLKNYDQLESTIGFMVGRSDDLMPKDYLNALLEAKGKPDPAAAALEFLAKERNPQIKDLAATYGDIGVKQSDDVLLATKSMRFFSGKFIIDSYWTGFLTQGDEAPRPGYTQKLPPMASALEVMGLLGSDYAKSQIPKLEFYNKAIDQAMGELQAKTDTLTDADWQRNLYTAWMWTIKGLFDWQKLNHDKLPRYMQSPSWEVKTLQTASAFWTQLRHATILYAKQSFAELGGGPGGCDSRAIPPPPKSYVEPQVAAYARLSFLAKKTDAGLTDMGFDLANLIPLRKFIALMDKVQSYSQGELADKELTEKTVSMSRPDPMDETKTCTETVIDGDSDWENLRLGIIADLQGSLPIPTEGQIMTAKDRREAIVADVHTGGDSDNPTRILYEGVGVPYVLFVAVKDANGPRLTVGFASSHYEFTQEYGGKRLADEDWQTGFYQNDDEPYAPFTYTEQSKWPKPNFWLQPLFGATMSK